MDEDLCKKLHSIVHACNLNAGKSQDWRIARADRLASLVDSVISGFGKRLGFKNNMESNWKKCSLTSGLCIHIHVQVMCTLTHNVSTEETLGRGGDLLLLSFCS